MKHFGDITKINGAEVPVVDIVTGGSPCQDLSIAGKRAGMLHSDLGSDETTRSGLFMEQLRIIKEMRDADRERTGRTDEFLRPRYMVWENVEGVFSSNDGEDFRCVLEETARVCDSSATIPRLPTGESWSHAGAVLADRWSLAWKVHDAQFFGLAQRRRRVSLVADFGGQSALEILFERESLSGDSETSRETREGTPKGSEGCPSQTSLTLKVRGGAEYDSHGKQAGKGALIQEELSGTLGVSQDQTLFCFGISPYESNAMKSDNPYSGIYEAETSRTLDIHGANPDCQQGGVLVLENHPQDSRIKIKEDGIFQTMGARQGGEGDPHTLMVMQTREVSAVDCLHGDETGDLNMTLQANCYKSLNNNNTVRIDSQIRRLTPLECERLQGFPDGWTDIGDWTDTKGKKHKASDSPRYKALGNSIAVGYANNKKGFWCWLADRIVKALREQGTVNPTMASLFDGIGGFPLAFSAYGCTPVWASEIEEFPIAVTKKHFPDKEEETNG